MVINFRARGISRCAFKLARTFTLIKKKKNQLPFLINQELRKKSLIIRLKINVLFIKIIKTSSNASLIIRIFLSFLKLINVLFIEIINL